MDNLNLTFNDMEKELRNMTITMWGLFIFLLSCAGVCFLIEEWLYGCCNIIWAFVTLGTWRNLVEQVERTNAIRKDIIKTEALAEHLDKLKEEYVLFTIAYCQAFGTDVTAEEVIKSYNGQ